MNLYPTAALLVVLGLASPASLFAQAAPTADIEAQHRQGMALRAEHHDQEARTLFEGLWTRTHEPRARARQALAEHSLNMFAEAEVHLVEALSHQDDAWIRQSRSVLEPILQQARAGQGISVLNVVCATAGAEIFVNGSSAGRPGELVRVAPGRITFEVRAPGFATVSRSIELQVGATVNEDVTLVTAAQTETNTQVPTGQTTAQTTGIPSGLVTRQPPPPSTGDGMRTAAWVTGGVAVAGLGVGVLGLAVGIGPAGIWNNDERCRDPNAQDCQSALQTARMWEPVMQVGFVVGGALAATSAVFFIVSAGSSSRSESVARGRVVCAPGVGLTSVSCGGTF